MILQFLFLFILTSPTADRWGSMWAAASAPLIVCIMFTLRDLFEPICRSVRQRRLLEITFLFKGEETSETQAPGLIPLNALPTAITNMKDVINTAFEKHTKTNVCRKYTLSERSCWHSAAGECEGCSRPCGEVSPALGIVHAAWPAAPRSELWTWGWRSSGENVKR